MTVVLAVLLVLNLAVLGAVLLLVLGQRRRLREAEEVLGDAADVPQFSPELEEAFDTGKRRLITIEILNPMELAAQESRFGSVAAGIAPGALRKVVNTQALKMIEEELEARGVVAEVTLHVARR